MPERKNAPRIKVVVEFIIDTPEPGEISKTDVDCMHRILRDVLHEKVVGQVSWAGMRASHVRTTRMVK